MTKPRILTTEYGATLAYHQQGGDGPGVVFLGGFRSDMEGTKALFLEDWAKSKGRAFLRMDYTGHGQSSGDFADGSIGEWARDAITAIEALTDGPQILIGSSMGGWISLLVARSSPKKVAGFIGIAAAPDFTEDGMWPGLTPAQQQEVETKGQVALAHDYSDEPYIITKKLIADGRRHLVLRSPLDLRFPVRLLQGTADADVDVSVATNLLGHITCADARLSLVKNADHRFSEPQFLSLIAKTIHSVDMALARTGTAAG